MFNIHAAGGTVTPALTYGAGAGMASSATTDSLDPCDAAAKECESEIAMSCLAP